MFLATINKPKQLLHLSFAGRVQLQELERGREQMPDILASLEDGFRVLTDLERLESIEDGSATEIGKVMALCDERNVSLIVRLVPDPRKDIGLNILALFHYKRRRPRHVSCTTMTEAAKLLDL